MSLWRIAVTDQNTDAAFVSIPIDVVDEASVAAAPVYVGEKACKAGKIPPRNGVQASVK